MMKPTNGVQAPATYVFTCVGRHQVVRCSPNNLMSGAKSVVRGIDAALCWCVLSLMTARAAHETVSFFGSFDDVSDLQLVFTFRPLPLLLLVTSSLTQPKSTTTRRARVQEREAAAAGGVESPMAIIS